MPVAKYRKKPIEIEAIQWTGKNTDLVAGWIRGGGGSVLVGGINERAQRVMLIRTLEGPLSVTVGDYVIQGIAQEFYPCKPKIFAATYDTIEAEGD